MFPRTGFFVWEGFAGGKSSLARVVPRSGIGSAPVVVPKSETTSEAVARDLRVASLEGFAGKWWFLGSEAVVAGLRGASLRKSGREIGLRRG